jgi:lipopolysaccharide export system protein LptC
MNDMSIALDGHSENRLLAFSAARRHTRLIALLRLLVPATAVLLSAGFVLMSYLDIRSLTEPQFDPDATAISGSTITMEQPRLTGYNNQRRPYELIATRAEQDITAPAKIDLNQLAARMQLEGDGWARLESNQGFFDNEAQTLRLNKDVNVTSNTGYHAVMNSADVDLEAGRVTSDEPVAVTFDAGQLNADRIEIRDGGDLIIFQGRVRMKIEPSKASGKGDKAT